MTKLPAFEFIHLDDQSATPKYLQLANSIINAVRTGKMKKEEILPSINELSFCLEISRDTAEKGYKHLKEMGILGSVPGKGYFIKSTETVHPLKIFLLFNKLSALKKIIYDAIVRQLLDRATIDFYVYNNDFSLFKKILNSKIGEYTHYIVIPHFIEGGEHAPEIINQIDKNIRIEIGSLAFDKLSYSHWSRSARIKAWASAADLKSPWPAPIHFAISTPLALLLTAPRAATVCGRKTILPPSTMASNKSPVTA